MQMEGSVLEEHYRQARRYWHLGVGEALGATPFERYWAGIPEIPDTLWGKNEAFPRLVLVEPRLNLATLCRLAGVILTKRPDALVDRRHGYQHRYAAYVIPTWIRVNDGKDARRCDHPMRTHGSRAEWRPKGLNPLLALEGVCAHVQHPDLLRDTAKPDGYYLSLLATADRHSRLAAVLRLHAGRVRLSVNDVNRAEQAGIPSLYEPPPATSHHPRASSRMEVH